MKMKKLIYQVYTGKRKKLYDFCTASVKKYADRIGADYIVQRQPILMIKPDIFQTNRSNESVTIKKVNKVSTEVAQRYELNPYSKAKIYISKNETVYVENENEVSIKVEVVLSKKVQGMRYISK